ncbi:MAG: hypothetical protein ACP5SB_06210 [Caldisericaceae bacterium]
MKKTAESKIIGTYKYPHFANKSKIHTISLILKEYRLTAQQIANLHWTYFFKTKGKLNKFLDLKDISSKLSERYKQTCSHQVLAMIDSYLSNIQDKIRHLIWQTSFSYEDKLIMLAINAQRGWYEFDKEEITTKIKMVKQIKN